MKSQSNRSGRLAGSLSSSATQLMETASIGRCFKDQGYLRDDWS
jgi:hypothetical protein